MPTVMGVYPVPYPAQLFTVLSHWEALLPLSILYALFLKVSIVFRVTSNSHYAGNETLHLASLGASLHRDVVRGGVSGA